MKNAYSRNTARGFTLIEVLIVMAIIAVLAALSIGGFQYVRDKQKFSSAELQIGLLSKALEEYKLDNGEYPDVTSTNELFQALYWDTDDDGTGADTDDDQKIYVAELNPGNNSQKWISGTGSTATIIDPWGQEYIYRIGSDASARNPDFDLLSTGPDEDETTEGDNVSNF